MNEAGASKSARLKKKKNVFVMVFYIYILFVYFRDATATVIQSRTLTRRGRPPHSGTVVKEEQLYNKRTVY